MGAISRMCVCAVIKHPRWKPFETDRTFGTLLNCFESVCTQFECSSITKEKKTETIKAMSCLVANYRCIRSNAVISKACHRNSVLSQNLDIVDIVNAQSNVMNLLEIKTESDQMELTSGLVRRRPRVILRKWPSVLRGAKRKPWAVLLRYVRAQTKPTDVIHPEIPSITG